MRRRQNGRTTTTITFCTTSNAKLIRASSKDDDDSDHPALPLPDRMRISDIIGKPYVPEVYHYKVTSWECELASLTRITSICLSPLSPLNLRLSRQSQQHRQEIFTISDESHVAQLLKKLKEAGEEMTGIMEGSIEDAILRTYTTKRSTVVMNRIKIAWTSSPFFYVEEPGWAMSWLKQKLMSNHFFFPSQVALAEEREDEQESSGGPFQALRKFLQLERLLAVCLRKSIIRSWEASKVPSNLAKIPKLLQFADSVSYLSRKSTKEVFSMSLMAALANRFEKYRRIGQDIEEQYFASLEREAKRLIENLEKPVPVKPTKRVKRNLKKADERKKKEELSSKVKNNNPSINPEETAALSSIVDPNAYKFGEHQDDVKTPATSSQESKSPTTTKMFTEYFVPPTKDIENQRKGTGSTASKNSRFREISPESVKPRRNRNGQRQYEEKPTFATEAINNENHVKKAAYSVFNRLLESKLYQLKQANDSIMKIKVDCINWLVAFIKARQPEDDWGVWGVDIFGSLATGVTLPNSDIDILLTPPSLPVDEYFMSDLANDLTAFEWVAYCNAILTAKIPVIKLAIAYTTEGQEPSLIKFDITLNTAGPHNTGLVSSAFMQNSFNFKPKLTEAILVVKHILDAAGLNEGYKGGISSYNIFVMVICFAEHIQFSFDKPLSEFLIYFFRFYTKEFDYKKYVLRYYPGGRCVLSFSEYGSLENAENLGNSGALKMIDPINGQLVRASFSRFEEVLNLFRQLAEAFEEMREEARQAVKPLMGKTKNKWEIPSALEDSVAASSSARKLALLLLIN